MLPSLVNAFHRIFSTESRAHARAKSAPRRTFQPAVEALDQRILPTIGLSGGMLSAIGTNGSDTIAIDTFLQNNNLMIRATVNAEVRTFSAAQVSSIEIIADDSADTINLKNDALAIPVNVRGGFGLDTLLGPDSHLVGTSLDTTNVWKIGVDNTLNGYIHFFDVEKFTGGDSGSDQFRIQSTSFSGTIKGGGGNDSVTGPSASNAWNVTGANAGTLSYFDDVPYTINGHSYTLPMQRTVNFAGVENLTGSDRTDTFAFQDGQKVSGQVSGGGGTDTVDYSAYTTAVTVDFANQSFTGAGSMTSIENFVGGSAAGSTGDLLAGPNAKNVWSITANDAGSLTSSGLSLFVTFQSFEHLVGGMSTDTFNFSDQARVTGFIEGSPSGTAEGGANDDHLNFVNYTTSITLKDKGDHGNIDWTPGDPNDSVTPWHNIDRFTGGSAGDTLALDQGDNMVKIDAANGGEYAQPDIQNGGAFPASPLLTFSSVENIIGGGSRDVFLMVGSGSVDSIDGGANGQDLIDYSAYAAGVTVNLDERTATATGVKTISNVENINGSPYDDILIGNSASNEIHGLGGNDVLVGLAGNDYLVGDEPGAANLGRDILIGGDGADYLFGGGNGDLLIGNRVTFETDITRLKDMLKVWTGSLSYVERVKTLRSDLDDTTVLADGAIDQVFGGDANAPGGTTSGADTSNEDWFWTTNGVDGNNHVSGEFVN